MQYLVSKNCIHFQNTRILFRSDIPKTDVLHDAFMLNYIRVSAFQSNNLVLYLSVPVQGHLCGSMIFFFT
jgi:hypothetical protein